MNKLTLQVTTLVIVFYMGLAADELPQTAQYDTAYDSEGAVGSVRFVVPYDMEIVEAEPRLRLYGRRVPSGAVEGRRNVRDCLSDRY